MRCVLAAAFATVVLSVPRGGSQVQAADPYEWYGAGPDAPKIGLIGDSSLTGVRWTNSYSSLTSVNFRMDAESCRRTVLTSCFGLTEQFRPPSALDELRAAPGAWGELLVMVTGYNDPGYNFAGAIDAIMDEAGAQHIDTVMWFTMRTADVSYVSPGYRTNSSTFADNNRILLQKAAEYGDRLQVADWATHSANRDGWMYADGVHVTPAGARAMMRFVSDLAPRVIAGETITPDVRCHGRPVTMLGSPFADTMTGTSGDDVIAGNGGADVIDGRGGDDIICGGWGNDRIIGGSGRDTIDGGPGNDTLTG